MSSNDPIATLGKIRGTGSLLTHAFSAGGPPFFGLLFDFTQSYYLSFSIFIGLLIVSAFLASSSARLRSDVKLARRADLSLASSDSSMDLLSGELEIS